MKQKSFYLLLVIVLTFTNYSFSKDKHFKRVEEFPQGEQTKSMIGSFFTGIKDVNAESHNFNEPLEMIWPVIKRVANNFAKIGGRTVSGINEDLHLIQNGMISQNAMIGMGSGAWLDQIQMQASKEGNQTKVEVSRKVVQKEFTQARAWKTQLSNGKIERYLLTQIEDELSGKASVGESATEKTVFSPVGKFSRKDQPSDFIQFKSDGTFILKQAGVGYSGTYGIGDHEIKCMLANGNGLGIRIIIQGDVLYDTNGKMWLRNELETSKEQSTEVLKNEDIIKMVKAKLSSKVIIAKINKSKCDFETNTDAMIALKQSGVSDEIIQIMTEAEK